MIESHSLSKCMKLSFLSGCLLSHQNSNLTPKNFLKMLIIRIQTTKTSSNANSLERVGILKGNKHLGPRLSKITSNSRCSAVINTSGSHHSGRTGALRTGHFQQNWQEYTQTPTCPKIRICFDNIHSASFSGLSFFLLCMCLFLFALSETRTGWKTLWD